MTDLYKVGFISMDDVGVPDYREYQYEVEKFDKIVEYDGNYILLDKKDHCGLWIEFIE